MSKSSSSQAQTTTAITRDYEGDVYGDGAPVTQIDLAGARLGARSSIAVTSNGLSARQVQSLVAQFDQGRLAMAAQVGQIQSDALSAVGAIAGENAAALQDISRSQTNTETEAGRLIKQLAVPVLALIVAVMLLTKVLK